MVRLLEGVEKDEEKKLLYSRMISSSSFLTSAANPRSPTVSA